MLLPADVRPNTQVDVLLAVDALLQFPVVSIPHVSVAVYEVPWESDYW